MNVMKVLGRTGDTEVKWNPHTGEGLQSASRIFEEKINRGYLAFVEGPNGEGSILIRNFDSQAESIILAPRLVGGLTCCSLIVAPAHAGGRGFGAQHLASCFRHGLSTDSSIPGLDILMGSTSIVIAYPASVPAAASVPRFY